MLLIEKTVRRWSCLSAVAVLALFAVACGDSDGAGADVPVSSADTTAGADINPAGEDAVATIDTLAAGTDAQTAADVAPDAVGPDAPLDAADSQVGVDTQDAAADGDAAVDSDGCPGKLGCACATDSECGANLCKPAPAPATGKVCSAPCVKTVPETEACDGVDNDCDGQTDNNTCNDSNVCTQDACVAAAGGKPTCQNVAAAGACDDGSACTDKDACLNGTCAGAKVICDDKNPCTDDSCDAAKGCTATDNAATCDDGSACTGQDACAGGKCAGAKVTCNDQNPCTDDACDPAAGCTATVNTAGCSDGSACTDKDTCAQGKCAGVAVVCDDKNPCTDDACDVAKGCTATDNTAACDDGSKCTELDLCAAGKCAGSKVLCDDQNPCTDDSCLPTQGCAAVNNANACDDGSLCTAKDTCSNGACVGAKVACDDQNPCTNDGCAPAKGCTATDNTATCDDSNACTTKDACSGSVCVGAAVKCDDQNPCTDDSCNPAKGCVNTFNTAPCFDNSACTAKDTCSGGACKGQAVVCDDNNACTTDSCDIAVGCTATDKTAACDDGTACTSGDKCAGGACVGAKVVCDDKNPCTDDACDAVKGCVATNNLAACDDGTACTAEDTCAAGMCAGKAISCNDGSGCTVDACDPKTGCTNAATPNCAGLPYKTNFECDGSDAKEWKLDAKLGALGWAIDGTPNTPAPYSPSCTLNYNNGTNYNCPFGSSSLLSYATGPTLDATGVSATSGLSASFQLAGNWESGTWDDVEFQASLDGKQWTTMASYDSTLGWKAVTVDLKSYVGKVFSVRFRFSTLDCEFNGTAGAFVDDFRVSVPCSNDQACNDGAVCTKDTCVAGSCVITAASGPCDDGNPCQSGDQCANKQCVAGKTVKCDDGNPCSIDACDAKTGACSATNVGDGTACKDGNPCHIVTACMAGKCQSQVDMYCADDGKVCTSRGCDPASGACAAKPIANCSETPISCTTGAGSAAPYQCSTGYQAPANCSGTVGTGCPAGGHLCVVGTDAALGPFGKKATWHYQVAATDVAALAKDCTEVQNGVFFPAGSAPPVLQGLQLWLDAADAKSMTLDADGQVAKWHDKSGGGNHPVQNSTGARPKWQAKAQLGVPGVGFDGGGDWMLLPDFMYASPVTVIAVATKKATSAVGPTLFANYGATPPANDLITMNDISGGWVRDSAGKVLDAKLPSATGLAIRTVRFDPEAGTLSVNHNGTAKTVSGTVTANLTFGGGEPPLLGAQGLADVNGVAPNYNTFWRGDVHELLIFDRALSPQELTALQAWLTTRWVNCGSCDDNNSCTDDSCTVATLTCAHVAKDGACTDNNPCTVGDTCATGKCSVGSGALCDDKNPCTSDSCDSVSGKCAVVNNAAPCNDANVCTTTDTCKGGACQGGIPLDCDDKNTCTTESCDKLAGCTKAPATGSCEDGNACTSPDTCVNSACKPGATKTCDDSNPCTTDSCDTKTAACTNQAQADAVACDDGKPCTTASACSAGVCKGTANKVCADDGKVCTFEGCNTITGACVSTPMADCVEAGCADNSGKDPAFYLCAQVHLVKGGVCPVGTTATCSAAATASCIIPSAFGPAFQQSLFYYNVPESQYAAIEAGCKSQGGTYKKLAGLAVPAQVPGLLLWLDATDTASMTKDANGALSKWLDKSGKGAHPVQSSASAQPKWKAIADIGKPGVMFDGGSDWMAMPELQASSSLTVVAVATKRTSSAAPPTLFGNYGKDPGYELVVINDQNGGWARDANDKVLTPNAAQPLGLGIRFVALDAANGKLTVTTNGVAKEVTGVFAKDVSFGGGEPPLLGAQGSAGPVATPNVGTFWNGDLHEFLVYDHALTAKEQATLAAYLATRWSACGGVCDDGNACTTDTCDANGKCQYANNTVDCSGVNACGAASLCSGGACVAASACFSLNVAESINTSWVGGNFASSAVTANCPAGSVAVGYEGAKGAWMDRFRLICAPLGANGSLGTTLSQTAWLGSSSGGTVFGPGMCAAGKVLVRMKMNAGDQLDSVTGYCLSAAEVAAATAVTGATAAPAYGSVGGSAYDVACAAGAAMTGMNGYAGEYPHAVRFRCSPLAKK